MDYNYDKLSFERDSFREKYEYPPQTDTISELIEVLELIEEEHGDLPVQNHYLELSISPKVHNGVVDL